mmetsp:Transcript_112267/g.194615  ORF Transcript_112267/g.194615 Transcript_112267/m.194615 type:complete len:212 (+) Transcript_112267:1513-2148(+)
MLFYALRQQLRRFNFGFCLFLLLGLKDHVHEVRVADKSPDIAVIVLDRHVHTDLHGTPKSSSYLAIKNTKRALDQKVIALLRKVNIIHHQSYCIPATMFLCRKARGSVHPLKQESMLQAVMLVTNCPINILDQGNLALSSCARTLLVRIAFLLHLSSLSNQINARPRVASRKRLECLCSCHAVSSKLNFCLFFNTRRTTLQQMAGLLYENK